MPSSSAAVYWRRVRIPAVVSVRNPRWDANPERRTGQNSHPRDAKWGYCRGARRCLGSTQTSEAERPRIAQADVHCDPLYARQRGYEPGMTEPLTCVVDGISARVSFESELASPFPLIAVAT